MLIADMGISSDQVRRCLKTVGVCLALAVAPFANGQSSAQSASTSGAKSAEQVYRNIQVLKGIPADELIPSMRFITASLGVECGFCHVEQHFDKDDKKPKQIARKMIQMVTAINQNNFQSHQMVTCNSCHRGSPMPVSIPAVEQQPAMLAMEGRQPAPHLPSADDLISKYVEASGGASALQKVNTRSESGTAEFFGHQIQVEILDKAPDKLLSITHLPNGDSVEGLNSDEGWQIYPHRPSMAMSSSEVEGAKTEADLQLALHLTRMFPQLRVEAPEKIDGREMNQLVAIKDELPRAKFYFDAQSGLLVRMVQYFETPLGLNPVQTDYADYRPVDGVQVPFRWTTSRPGTKFTIQLSDVKQNVPIDDAKFVKPPTTGAP